MLNNIRQLNFNNTKILDIHTKYGKYNQKKDNILLTQNAIEEVIEENLPFSFIDMHRNNLLYDSLNVDKNIYGYSVELFEETKEFKFKDLENLKSEVVYLPNTVYKDNVEYTNVCRHSFETEPIAYKPTYLSDGDVLVDNESGDFLRIDLYFTVPEDTIVYFPPNYFGNEGDKAGYLYKNDYNNEELFKHLFYDYECLQPVKIKNEGIGKIRLTSVFGRPDVDLTEQDVKKICKYPLYHNSNRLQKSDFTQTGETYKFPENFNVELTTFDNSRVIIFNFITDCSGFFYIVKSGVSREISATDFEVSETYTIPNKPMFLHFDSNTPNHFLFILPENRSTSDYGYESTPSSNLTIRRPTEISKILDVSGDVKKIIISSQLEEKPDLNIKNSNSESIIEIEFPNLFDSHIYSSNRNYINIYIKGNYKNCHFPEIYCNELYLGSDFLEGVDIDNTTGTVINLIGIHASKIYVTNKFLNTKLSGNQLIAKLHVILNNSSNMELI